MPFHLRNKNIFNAKLIDVQYCAYINENDKGPTNVTEKRGCIFVFLGAFDLKRGDSVLLPKYFPVDQAKANDGVNPAIDGTPEACGILFAVPLPHPTKLPTGQPEGRGQEEGGQARTRKFETHNPSEMRQ